MKSGLNLLASMIAFLCGSVFGSVFADDSGTGFHGKPLKTSSRPVEYKMKIQHSFLEFPISQRDSRQRLTISCKETDSYSFDIRIASSEPEYWVFIDVSDYLGKTLSITYPEDRKGLSLIRQADELSDTVYAESGRPQLHYTPRRGWNNDPNGLVYYDGEYHLFYQHNPFEKEWGNMHWGHAVSNDLIHWKELPDAMRPDKFGTVFSGSAVIDYANTSGFGKGGNPPMVAVYTADSPDREVQCVAYSLDKGRTWTRYSGNPVIDSREFAGSRDTRDPKVFWHEPSHKWVMVLNEKDGHSIYNSDNLKDWTYQSHVTGFWECPELFELSVDGDPDNTKWVMYGASCTYMIGDFDGRTFTPEAGKYYYTTGSAYAGQTFNNIPVSDGRRIQISWGRISHPGMPINGTFLFPVELTLRNTKDGVRMFSYPVRELQSLQEKVYEGSDLTQDEAVNILQHYKNDNLLRINARIRLSHATSAVLRLNGQSLLDYDMNATRINGVFYSPEDRTSMELTFDMYLDVDMVETFIDGGAYSYSMELRPSPGNSEGFRFSGNNVEFVSLEIYRMDSIWSR